VSQTSALSQATILYSDARGLARRLEDRWGRLQEDRKVAGAFRTGPASRASTGVTPSAPMGCPTTSSLAICLEPDCLLDEP
jgi:hypothetical protein